MRKYIIAVILLIFTGCGTQQKTVKTVWTKIEETDMRKFNLDLYEKNRQGYSSYEYFTKNEEGDSIRIILMGYDNSYMEQLYKINSPFTYTYLYDKTTLNVILEMEKFYDCAIGIKKRYNAQGELIEQINYDAQYPFGWQDLVEMMKKKYKIDLMDIKGQIARNRRISVYRTTDSNRPNAYYLKIPIRPEVIDGMYGMRVRRLNISSDGEVFFMQDDEGRMLINKEEEFKKGTLTRKKNIWSTLFD